MSKSIISNEKICFISERDYDLEKHHCMNGTASRKKSEEDGLWVWLNSEIHFMVHNTRPDLKRYLKCVAQEAYERNHTREEWMKRYHKNYLGD